MSDNETQAAIAAEMRTYFQTQKRNGNPEHRPWHQVLSDWADRIEAAAKRERIQRDKVSFRCGDCARFGGDCDAGDSDGNEDRVACEKFVRRALVPGDAAAMRAALEEQLRYWDTHVRTRDEEAMRQHIEAALAKPARNCDRFRTSDDASAYWAANVHAVPLHGDAYAMRIDGREFATFLDWLFATAKEGK